MYYLSLEYSHTLKSRSFTIESEGHDSPWLNRWVVRQLIHGPTELHITRKEQVSRKIICPPTYDC